MTTKIKKQKQKQKQTQNVKQTVIVKLDGQAKKVKVKRRRVRRYPTEGVDVMTRQLPPPVIYQSSYQIPVPVFSEPEKPKTVAPAPVEKPFLQDVGVGTEGFVTILDVPTKKEQLKDLITPVDNISRDERIRAKLKEYWFSDYPEKPFISEEDNIKFRNKMEEKKRYFASLKEPSGESIFVSKPSEENLKFNKKMEETKKLFASLKEPIGEPLSKPLLSEEDLKFNKKMEDKKKLFASLKEPIGEPITGEEEKRTRRTKQQMEEARQMGREDIASINLGLSQFNTAFTQPAIQETLPSKGSEEKVAKEPNIPSEFQPQFTKPSIGKYAAKLPREELTQSSLMSEEQNIPESVLEKEPKKGTWHYWLTKYKDVTGENISYATARKRFETKDNFISHVNKIM